MDKKIEEKIEELEKHKVTIEAQYQQVLGALAVLYDLREDKVTASTK